MTNRLGGLVLGAFMLVAAGGGVLAAMSPRWLVASLIAILGAGMITRPMGRLIVFTLGGLIAMGGDSGLDSMKLAYAAAVAICAVVSFVRLLRSHYDVRVKRATMLASLAILVALGLALSAGVANGSQPKLIAQDAFTYFLIAAAPIIGLDAALGGSWKAFKTLTILLAVASSAGWAVWWLAQRHSPVLGLENLTLVTSFLAFSTLGISLTLAINARRSFERLTWLLLSVVVPVIYIASGSRSMLVFALGLLGILGAKAYGRFPVAKWVSSVVVVFSGALAVIPYLMSSLEGGKKLLARFTQTFDLLGSGGIETDGSYIERSRAYEYTLDAFREAPWFGQGFGHLYPAVDLESMGDLKVDSPFLILAKFGIVGTILFVLFAICIWKLVRLSRGPRRLRMGETAVRVFVLITLGRLLFIAPTEDKGFAYAIAMLVTFAIMAASTKASEFIAPPKKQLASLRSG